MRNELEEEARKADGKVKWYSKDRANELLQKKRVMLTCVHPDTNEVIKFVCRVSAFVPMNVPIIGAMMLSPPTVMSTIFWQWTNQTYNAGFNYGNRNATSKTTDMELLQSYLIACSSACITATILRKITNPLLAGSTGVALALANAVVNYGAVGISSSLNLFFMRQAEIKKGISVLDPETGELVGTSKAAAHQAVSKTIQTRWSYLVPIFFTQPILLKLFQTLHVYPRVGKLRSVADLMMVTTGLTLAIPTCCALYPQMSSISLEELEPEI